jgi:hypothetical protein
MKVKDLIEKLQGCDPEAVVLVRSSNFELGGSEVEAKYVHESKEGSLSQKQCVDAFDYTRYSTPVWSTIGGDKTVVSIS